MTEQFANRATTQLTAGIDDNDAAIHVQSAALPWPQGATDSWRVRIDDEILLITAGASTTTWVVLRGQEGTTAIAHASGASVRQVITAAALEGLRSLETGLDLSDFDVGQVVGKLSDPNVVGAITLRRPGEVRLKEDCGAYLDCLSVATGQMTAGGNTVTITAGSSGFAFSAGVDDNPAAPRLIMVSRAADDSRFPNDQGTLWGEIDEVLSTTSCKIRPIGGDPGDALTADYTVKNAYVAFGHDDTAACRDWADLIPGIQTTTGGKDPSGGVMAAEPGRALVHDADADGFIIQVYQKGVRIEGMAAAGASMNNPAGTGPYKAGGFAIATGDPTIMLLNGDLVISGGTSTSQAGTHVKEITFEDLSQSYVATGFKYSGTVHGTTENLRFFRCARGIACDSSNSKDASWWDHGGNQFDRCQVAYYMPSHSNTIRAKDIQVDIGQAGIVMGKGLSQKVREFKADHHSAFAYAVNKLYDSTNPGDVIPSVPNGHRYTVTTVGTGTGTDADGTSFPKFPTEPSWPTNPGATVTQSSWVFTEAGPVYAWDGGKLEGPRSIIVGGFGTEETLVSSPDEPGTGANSGRAWPTTAGGTTMIPGVSGGDDIAWEEAGSSAGESAWAAGHSYHPGDLVHPTTPNGHRYRVMGICGVGSSCSIIGPTTERHNEQMDEVYEGIFCHVRLAKSGITIKGVNLHGGIKKIKEVLPLTGVSGSPAYGAFLQIDGVDTSTTGKTWGVDVDGCNAANVRDGIRFGPYSANAHVQNVQATYDRYMLWFQDGTKDNVVELPFSSQSDHAIQDDNGDDSTNVVRGDAWKNDRQMTPRYSGVVPDTYGRNGDQIIDDEGFKFKDADAWAQAGGGETTHPVVMRLGVGGGLLGVAGTNAADYHAAVPENCTISEIVALCKTAPSVAMTVQLRKSVNDGSSFSNVSGALATFTVGGEIVIRTTGLTADLDKGDILNLTLGGTQGGADLSLTIIATSR